MVVISLMMMFKISNSRMKLAQRYRYNSPNNRQLRFNKILVSRKIKLKEIFQHSIYQTFFLHKKKKTRFSFGQKFPFLKMSFLQLLKKYNSYMSNSNKNSAIYQYQHLMKLIAHFAQHKPTMMVQLMRVN